MVGDDADRATWAHGIDRRVLFFAVLLTGSVCAASFLTSDWTRNDFERFDDLRRTALFFVLLGGAAFAYAAWWLEPRPQSLATVATVSTAAIAAALASFPVGSKDVFLYAAFGKVWQTYQTNPYLVAPAAFVADPWQPYLKVVWAEQPAPYGPLFLWQARLIDALAGGDLLLAVWSYKTVATAALVGTILVAGRLMTATSEAGWVHRVALLAWNPLLVFECAGNGHNDAVVLLLLLGAVWLHTRGGASRQVGVPATLALAIWYKWYAALFLPAFGVAVWREGGGQMLRRWSTAMLGAVILLGAVLLAPMADALPHMSRRLWSHENLREVFPLQLSPALAGLLAGVRAAGLTGGAIGLEWFDLIRFGLFALTALAVLVLQVQGRVLLVESICGLAVAFTQLIVTILWPWHLILPATFGFMAAGWGWHAVALALTLVGILSYFLTFVWATILLAVLAAALAALRGARLSAHR